MRLYSRLGRNNRIVLIAVAALVLIAVGLLGFKLIRDRMNVDAMCNLIKTQQADQGVVTQVTTGTKTVAVIGDSYSSGYAIPSLAQSWEHALGTAKGWTMDVAAVPTSGLINPGVCGDYRFSGRVAAVKAANPDLLIVQDGLNDLDYPAGDVERAAVDLLSQFKGVKQVVVVGPDTVPGKNHLSDVDQALKGAAAQTGAKYVSTLDWRLDLGKDGGHLSETGHQQYAALLGQSLP